MDFPRQLIVQLFIAARARQQTQLAAVRRHGPSPARESGRSTALKLTIPAREQDHWTRRLCLVGAAVLQ